MSRMRGWRTRRPYNRNPLPSTPGLYHWSEWNSLVSVTMRGSSLYVTPPNGTEVKITPFTAGKFTKAG